MVAQKYISDRAILIHKVITIHISVVYLLSLGYFSNIQTTICSLRLAQKLPNDHCPVIVLSLDLVDLCVHAVCACKFLCSQIAMKDHAGNSLSPTCIATR